MTKLSLQKLRLADEKILEASLNVLPGCVTPFAILNDERSGVCTPHPPHPAAAEGAAARMLRASLLLQQEESLSAAAAYGCRLCCSSRTVSSGSSSRTVSSGSSSRPCSRVERNYTATNVSLSLLLLLLLQEGCDVAFGFKAKGQRHAGIGSSNAQLRVS